MPGLRPLSLLQHTHTLSLSLSLSLVMDLVQSPHMEGCSLAPGGSALPDPPSGPSKRPRSPPTGEYVSPTQGPSQKRRCDQDGRDEEEPHERGPDPSLSGNGSPSVVVVSP